MTTEVLVITVGLYSDYRIVSIFTEDQLTKAEEYIRLVCPNAQIERYPLNRTFTDPNVDRFDVLLERDGKCRYLEKIPRLSESGEAETRCTLRTGRDCDPTSIAYNDNSIWSLHWIGYANNEAYARRHVEELRRRILAGQSPKEVDMGNN